MKILHVITSLLYGGAEKLVAEISPMLRDKGHEVDVLAFNDAEPNFIHLLEENGIKVYTFGKNVNVYNPLFIPKLAKMMRVYDIVHTHNTSPQFFAALCSLVCHSYKLVTTEHNTYNRRRSIPLFKQLDRWMYSRYESVICISNQAETNLRKFLPTATGICTIYNGVDVSRYHEAQPIAGLHPEGKTVVVMVAAFRPQKDQKTLIDAFTHLSEEKFELWLVGDGELHDEIHAYANATGLQNIKFFGNRPDVPEVLHSADIVVMSSHWEGFGLAAVEGMAAGKPVIASNVDGLAQVVEGAGVLFEPGNDKDLAHKIEQLASNSDYYQQAADRGWQRAQMFDIQKMVDGYVAVYNQIYGKK